jgi:putative tryptophan/tyrosine transport system substrate-binding protein
MKRRELITFLGGSLAAWPLPASAAAEGTRYGRDSWSCHRQQLELRVRNALRGLGWILGQNLTIEYRWAEGDLARFPALVDELVRLKPDLMLAGNNQAAIAMKRVTAVIPIVAPTLFDPIGLGLIASPARPGGNVTGITSQDTLPEKNLELAVEAIRGGQNGRAVQSCISVAHDPTKGGRGCSGGTRDQSCFGGGPAARRSRRGIQVDGTPTR